jgi:hypothetical protein
VANRRGRRRILRRLLGQDLHEVVAGVRRDARDHLVADRAECVDIAARVGGAARGLLRRHVLGRPHRHARARQATLACGFCFGRLRDAEVEDLHDVGGSFARDEEDVLGLEIAVDDALRVRGGECAADLRGDLEGARDIEGAFALDDAAELDALEELHDEVHAAVGGGSGVGDVDDVRVTDLRCGARLAAEPLDEIGHARVAGMQDLERDALADLDVLGQVDLAHAAFADQLDHAIATVDLDPDQVRLGFSSSSAC